MKQLTVKLVGTLTNGARRSFVIEVPDDVNIATLDHHVLEELADEARIPWEFDAQGFVQVTAHFVDEGQDDSLPVIPFPKPDHSAGEPI